MHEKPKIFLETLYSEISVVLVNILIAMIGNRKYFMIIKMIRVSLTINFK